MNQNPITIEIEKRLQTQLSPVKLEIIDDSAKHAGHAGARENPGAGHYKVLICSSSFAGKNKIQRHRMVYEAIGSLMHTSIHALQLETKSPDEL